MKSAVLTAFILLLVAPTDQNDYCKICSDHTMCKYKDIDKSGCARERMDGDSIKKILRLHNNWRSIVAQGNAPSQPSAANMRRMRWDRELEDIATRWAVQCIDSHDTCRDTDTMKVGQNIAWNTYGDYSQLMTPWYDEVNKFDSKNIDPYSFDSNTGHYSQLAWAETFRIGCGATDRGAKAALRYCVVCNYGPGGNMQGGSMYKTGAPQSACPPTTSKDPDYTGLCSAPEDRTDAGAQRATGWLLALVTAVALANAGVHL